MKPSVVGCNPQSSKEAISVSTIGVPGLSASSSLGFDVVEIEVVLRVRIAVILLAVWICGQVFTDLLLLNL